jgi:hypothetical protein
MSFGRKRSGARWPQPKRDSLCSPSLQSLNTESTEDLSDLCVEFFLATEDTEALLVGGLIVGRFRPRFRFRFRHTTHGAEPYGTCSKAHKFAAAERSFVHSLETSIRLTLQAPALRCAWCDG